jgi:hypothetical protein
MPSAGFFLKKRTPILRPGLIAAWRAEANVFCWSLNQPTMLMRPPRLTAAAVLLSLTAWIHADDRISIRPHWEPGKSYTMETTMDMTMTMPSLGEQGRQHTEMTQIMNLTAAAVAGSDRCAVAVKTAGVKATMSMMGQTMTYDSADSAKSTPMLQQTFGALLGKEFSLIFDKDDKIVDIKGLENFGSTPVGGMKGPDTKQMAEAFRRGQEMGLPKERVAPGESWKFDDSITMDPIPPMHVVGNGSFDSVVDLDGRKHAKILFLGKFSVPADAKSPVPMTLGEGSVAQGEIYYDIAGRMVTKMDMNLLLKMSINGQDIPVTQKITQKTSLAK